MASNYKVKPRWVKGQSGNPSGRPKVPEHLKKYKLLTSESVSRLFNKYGAMTMSELQATIKDPFTPSLEITIASIIINAIKTGDQNRLEFFLNRTVGKVKETKDINVNLQQMPEHQVVALAKEAIQYLEASPADDIVDPISVEDVDGE